MLNAKLEIEKTIKPVVNKDKEMLMHINQDFKFFIDFNSNLDL